MLFMEVNLSKIESIVGKPIGPYLNQYAEN